MRSNLMPMWALILDNEILRGKWKLPLLYSSKEEADLHMREDLGRSIPKKAKLKRVYMYSELNIKTGRGDIKIIVREVKDAGTYTVE